MRKFTFFFMFVILFASFNISQAFASEAFPSSQDYHEQRLKFLKDKGFKPNVIYDVGAFRGLWSVEIKKVFNEAQFFLFEANEANKSYLEKLPFPHFIAVLGDHKGLVTFYANNTTGDSVFREQTQWYKKDSCLEKSVPMTTLATLVLENKIPLPNLIKIDVQGAEKLIIEGSKSIICHAEVVILETKILEYNKGAPLIYEMMQLMDGLGYCVLDILEWHYLPTHELNEIDLLFVKKDSALIKRGILW